MASKTAALQAMAKVSGVPFQVFVAQEKAATLLAQGKTEPNAPETDNKTVWLVAGGIGTVAAVAALLYFKFKSGGKLAGVEPTCACGR